MPAAARLRSLLTGLLAAALLFPGAGAPVLAVPPAGTCGLAGSGAVDDPYLVTSGADLSCINGDAYYWTSHLLQTQDIYMSGPAWTHGIGIDGNNFSGTYDGGTYVINGLSIEPTSSYQGLFGKTYQATIAHVRVNGTIVINTPAYIQWVGGLVGYSTGTTFTDVSASVNITASVQRASGFGGVAGGLDWSPSTLTDARSNGDIALTTTDDVADCIGGLVGCAYEGTLSSAAATGIISVTTHQSGPGSTADVQAMSIGGMVGFGQDMTIENGSATADITVTTTANALLLGKQSAIGGLVGNALRMTINGAVVTGSVDATASGPIGGIGGLVGAETETAITEAHATVTVTAASTGDYVLNAGGLVGQMDAGSLERVSSTTALVVSGPNGPSTIGGLVGSMYTNSTPPSITDAFARGSMSATGASYVGGLLGWTGTGTITRAYTTVGVTGLDHLGGFAGKVDTGTPTIVTPSSFWDTSATGQGSDDFAGEVAGVVGTDITTMRQRATYATGGGEGPGAWTSSWPIADGWAVAADTTDVWGICPAFNDGYPFLLWEQAHNPCSATLTVDEPSHGTITGSGIDCPGTCSVELGLMDMVTLTATPDAGYTFSEWTGQCAATQTSECTFQMEPGAQLGATFLPIAPDFTTPPVARFRTGVSLPTGTTPQIPVTIAWAASAPSATITKYQVWKCTALSCLDDSAWTVVPLASATALSVNTTVPSTGKFQFRVAATASTGARTMVEWMPTAARLVQQSNTAVKYAGTWATASGSAFSGGSLKWSGAAKATATYAFTGTQFALVTSKASLRGRVEVWVDGTRKVTLDLRGATANRVIAWRWLGSYAKHTVVLKVLGTAGRPRVDLDAFLTYNPGPPAPVAPSR